jgi:hypothetical protein
MTMTDPSQSMQLHGKIMNLECTPPEKSSGELRVAYKMGHRDARHAAAELALAAQPQAEPSSATVLRPAPAGKHPDCANGCSHPARSWAGPCQAQCVKTQEFHEQSGMDAAAAQLRFSTEIGANVLKPVTVPSATDEVMSAALSQSAAPAVQAESWMLDKAEWIADEFGASNDSKETREAHAAAIVEAMQAASKGVPAAQSADAVDALQSAVVHLLDMAPGLNAVQIAGRLMIADKRATRLRNAALSQSAAAAKEGT